MTQCRQMCTSRTARQRICRPSTKKRAQTLLLSSIILPRDSFTPRDSASPISWGKKSMFSDWGPWLQTERDGLKLKVIASMKPTERCYLQQWWSLRSPTLAPSFTWVHLELLSIQIINRTSDKGHHDQYPALQSNSKELSLRSYRYWTNKACSHKFWI